MLEPQRIMAALAKIRALYHSEADFQHAFAWELHRTSPEWDIRLEVPVRTSSGSIHLDLLARSTAGEVAIELKYKTRALTTALQGEQFNLLSHSAQDLGRYDFFKDLSRVETFAASGPNRSGYAIFLTDDSAYWKQPGSLAYGYAAFTMHEGRSVMGGLGWASVRRRAHAKGAKVISSCIATTLSRGPSIHQCPRVPMATFATCVSMQPPYNNSVNRTQIPLRGLCAGYLGR